MPRIAFTIRTAAFVTERGVAAPAMVRTGPLRVLAKVASQPAPQHLEQAVLLGVSFLTDNRIQQVLDGSGAVLSGSLLVP